MNGHEELIGRLVGRHADKTGTLSAGAQEELLRAVVKNPRSFISDPTDEAFGMVVDALDRHERAMRDEELIEDDEAFLASRSARMERLVADCQAALAVDANCLDAALIAVLASDEEPERTLEMLFELQQQHASTAPRSPCWEDLRSRSHLRLQAAISRCLLETSRYRLAAATCGHLMELDEKDHLGARRTCALAWARLEDERSFEELDQRFDRQGDTWLHLARVILLYKLGRPDGARRALLGYAQLVSGGAYALLRPVMADTYLPDRPRAQPLGYDEANMAIWEAEPIIVDTPDLPAWAADQPGFSASAWEFAERNGLEW